MEIGWHTIMEIEWHTIREIHWHNMVEIRHFVFKPYKPVLERIIGDLRQRKTRKFGDKHKIAIEAALTKALKIVARGENGNPHYKETARFIFHDYLPVLDLILGERHPELMANEYHRHHAEHLLEKILAQAPDIFLHFSFESVDDEFFVATRTAPMNLIGIDLRGLDDEAPQKPFADNFYMKNSEFAYHDLGHAEFTTMRDLLYMRSADKPIVRIVWEWEATRLRIKEVVDQVKTNDVDLADAMTNILFELLRERGFQFSLTVLKQELETRKWVEVIERKLRSGFYSHYPTNENRYSRLEEARLGLVKAVERFREIDQIQWIKTVKAEIVPVKLTFTPTLKYSTGRLDYIEIKDPGNSIVHSHNITGRVEETEIREMITAQVSPTRDSPLSEIVKDKIERVLSMKGHSVIIDKNKNIKVRRPDGSLENLRGFKVTDQDAHIIKRLENIEIFEINQVLGTEERAEDIAFTIRKPVQVLYGTLTLQQNLVTGFHVVSVKTVDGQVHTVPLVDTRVDPLTLSDLPSH